MSKISDYIIIRSVDMNELARMVNLSIADGFEPFGSICALLIPTDFHGNLTTNGPHNSITYIQPMVRYTNENRSH